LLETVPKGLNIMRKLIPILTALLLSSGLAQTQEPAPTVPENPPAPQNPAPENPVPETPVPETPVMPDAPVAPDAPSASPAPSSNFRYSLGGVLEAYLRLNPIDATGGTAFTLKFTGSLGPEDLPNATFSANLRSSFDAATGTTRVTLGETVLTAYIGDVDLSAGNLIVNWGSVDVFGVVNTINPIDAVSQERIAIPAVRAIWNISDGLKLEGVIAPGFTPSTLPAMAGALPLPTTLPPGVSIVGQDPIVDNRPKASLENVQYGLRLTSDVQLFDGGDVSINVYGGPRHTPSPSVKLNPTSQPGQFTVQPIFNYDWIHVIGADTNLTIGDVAIRAEAAYTFTQDAEGTNPNVGNPSLEGTVQAEYAISGINLTGLLNSRWQRGETGKSDAFGLNLGLIVASELDARTTVSGAWVQSLTDGSGTIRPNISYTLTDGFKFEGGLSLNYGSLGSSLNPTGMVAAEVRFGLKLSF
jgi:hypothetical protein